jgi:hypothetical protein
VCSLHIHAVCCVLFVVFVVFFECGVVQVVVFLKVNKQKQATHENSVVLHRAGLKYRENIRMLDPNSRCGLGIIPEYKYRQARLAKPEVLPVVTLGSE